MSFTKLLEDIMYPTNDPTMSWSFVTVLHGIGSRGVEAAADPLRVAYEVYGSVENGNDGRVRSVRNVCWGIGSVRTARVSGGSGVAGAAINPIWNRRLRQFQQQQS